MYYPGGRRRSGCEGEHAKITSKRIGHRNEGAEEQ